MVVDVLRVDKWLWAVRVYKTRTAATEACAGGHVRVADAAVKPSHLLKIGDEVSAKRGDQSLRYKVVALIDKRVGPQPAALCFEDLSPPAEPATVDTMFGPLTLAPRRERGAGRPTKRDRRDTDRLRGR